MDPEEDREWYAMLPYYNGGILFLPWDAGLRPLWGKKSAPSRPCSARRTLAQPMWDAVTRPASAVAVECLKRRRVPFCRLPDACHATFMHLYRRAVPLREAKLFHAFGAFLWPTWVRRAVRMGMALFWHELLGWQDPCRLADRRGLWKFLLPALADGLALARTMRSLYSRHIAPALQREAD